MFSGTHHDEPCQMVRFELFAPLLSKMVLNAFISLQVNQHFDLHENRTKFSEKRRKHLLFHPKIYQTAERFFSEWKEQRKRIEQLEAEIVRLRTSGGGDDSVSIDGVRVVIMEVEGNLKQLTSMLQELTRDPNTPHSQSLVRERVVENSWLHVRKSASLLNDTMLLNFFARLYLTPRWRWWSANDGARRRFTCRRIG